MKHLPHEPKATSAILGAGLLAITSLLAVSSAPAVTMPTQLFRTYLSINGSDSNPCTVTSPCRLLPAALAATQSGGEVWMLDSANYNTDTVQITQSVTILAVPGALGSVVANNGDTAIEVPTANVIVTLRNLVVRNFGVSVGSGVYLTGTGSQLIVEGSEFGGLRDAIIVDAAGAYLSATSSTFRTNIVGILLSGISASDVATGIIDQCTMVGPGTAISSNADGIIFTNANGTINNTKISNTRTGIEISSSTALLNNNVVANSYYGILLDGNSSVGYSSGNNSLDNDINVSGGTLNANGQY